MSKAGRYVAATVVNVVITALITTLLVLGYGYFIKSLSTLSVENLLFILLVSLIIALIIVSRIYRGIERFTLGEERRPIQRPSHILEIVDKKSFYKRGDSVYFYSRYEGSLYDGYFRNIIDCPPGKKFANGKTEIRTEAPRSYRRTLGTLPFRTGMLDGDGPFHERWGWVIPKDAPIGQYNVHMHVISWADSRVVYDLENSIAGETDTFTVAD